MATHVRTCVVQTGEVVVNLNDLIIRLLTMANNAQTSQEAETIKKIVDYLCQRRDNVTHK